MRGRNRPERAHAPLHDHSLLPKKPHERLGRFRIPARHQQDVGTFPHIAVKGCKVLQELGLASGGRPQRGEASSPVMRHSVRQTQGRTVRPANRQAGPTPSRLLERHADRARKAGPAVGVSGIEEIERLLRVVEPTPAIELPGVGPPEVLAPFRQGQGKDRVHGLGGGEEEIRARIRHLVEVDEHLRVPAVVL